MYIKLRDMYNKYPEHFFLLGYGLVCCGFGFGLGFRAAPRFDSMISSMVDGSAVIHLTPEALGKMTMSSGTIFNSPVGNLIVHRI